MRRVFLIYRWVEEHILRNFLAVAFLGPTAIVLMEVYRRYVMGASWPWNNDVVVYGILAVVFLHLGATERLNTHLRVTFLVDVLERRSTRAAATIRLLADVISIVYVWAFVFLGYVFVLFAMEVGRTVPSRIMPVWPSYAVLVVGMVLLGLWLLYRLWADILSIVKKEPLQGELLADQPPEPLAGPRDEEGR